MVNHLINPVWLGMLAVGACPCNPLLPHRSLEWWTPTPWGRFIELPCWTMNGPSPPQGTVRRRCDLVGWFGYQDLSSKTSSLWPVVKPQLTGGLIDFLFDFPSIWDVWTTNYIFLKGWLTTKQLGFCVASIGRIVGAEFNVDSPTGIGWGWWADFSSTWPSFRMRDDQLDHLRVKDHPAKQQ